MVEGVGMFEPVRVFQCPNCNETIDASAAQCRFCLAPIDAAAASAAAEVMAKVNQACSDASFLKTAGGALLLAFVMMLVPFASMIGRPAFLVLLVAIPAMAIRWWVRFGRVKTDDPEFGNARRTVVTLGIVVAAFLLIQLAMIASAFLPAPQ